MKFKTSESILGNSLKVYSYASLGITILYIIGPLYAIWAYNDSFHTYANTFTATGIVTGVILIVNIYMRTCSRKIFLMGDIEISYWGVTVTYHKKQIFHASWDSIQEIGIEIIGKSNKNTYVYFSKKPTQISKENMGRGISRRLITADFAYCSVLWDRRIPDILKFVPSYKEIHYLNGYFKKEGENWIHVF